MTIHTVTSDAEFTTAHTNAVASDTIRLANAGTFGVLTVTKSDLTIDSETALTPSCEQFIINGAQNVTVTGVRVQPTSTPSAGTRLIDFRGNVDGLNVHDNLVRCGDPDDSFSDFDVTADYTTYPGMGAPGGDATPNNLSDLPYGIGSTVAYSGTITLSNNEITDCGAGIKFSPTGTGGVLIQANFLDRIYSDYISLIVAAAADPAYIHILGNDMWNAFSQGQDNGNPHTDAIQVGLSAATTHLRGLVVAGNRYAQIPGCRGQPQRVFVSDGTDDYRYIAPIIIDNLMAARVTGNGIAVNNAVNAYVSRNTLLANPAANEINAAWNEAQINTANDPDTAAAVVSGTRISITSHDDQPSKHLSQGNITELSVTSVNTVDRGSGNLSIGIGTPGSPYSTTYFATPSGGWSAVDTAAEVITAYKPTTSYAAKGAVRSDDTDAAFLARWDGTADPWDEFVPFVGFFDGSNEQVSTVITSGWSHVHAGIGQTPAISISAGGEYQVADDFDGTGAGAWTSDAGTIAHGKWIRLRRTSSASYSTTVTTTLTIGAEDFDWRVSTLSNIPYPTVNMPGGVYVGFTGTQAAAANTIATLALVFKATQAVTGTAYYLFGDSSNVYTIRVRGLSTGKLRINMSDASNVSILGNWDSGQNVDTAKTYCLIISVDTTDTGLCKAQAWDLGGSSHLTWGAPASTTGEAIGFATSGIRRVNVGADGLIPDVDMVFLKVGSRLDPTDGGNAALFSAGLIGPAGEGPFGSAPEVFLAGDAAAWNAAGGINLGSGTKYVRSAESMTDVDSPQNAWPPVLALSAEIQTEGPYLPGSPIDILITANGYPKAIGITCTTDLDGDFDDSTPAMALGSNGIVVQFTPNEAGAFTLGFTNDGGYTNPSDLEFTVDAPEEGGGGGSSALRAMGLALGFRFSL